MKSLRAIIALTLLVGCAVGVPAKLAAQGPAARVYEATLPHLGLLDGPPFVEYSVQNLSALAGGPFDITLLLVSTSGEQPTTTNNNWNSQAVDATNWDLPMGGVAGHLTWHQFTGRAITNIIPGDPIHPRINGYFLNYGLDGLGRVDYSSVVFPSDPVHPGIASLRGGFLFRGSPGSDFFVMGPADAALPTLPAGLLSYSGPAEVIPEPTALALAVTGFGTLLTVSVARRSKRRRVR